MARISAADKLRLKEHAEADLLAFIKLVAPKRMLGAVHEELIYWWTREEGRDNQLVLLPRDHQKSALIAYRVAWWITRNPDTTILYVSATADLAEKQLKFIKDIFTSDSYRFYWPEMVQENENFREKWSVDEISVDHPKRKAEYVRDPTIKAVGLTANTTGLHCHVAVMDDVVVPGNAYTETGRAQVRAFYSQLSSIETTGAKEWVVGTRYHPADLYKDLIDMRELYWDSDGNEVEEEVYEVFERKVETNGEYLWPKQRREDGKTFGFDDRELARKKAKYLDVSQFYAQYYNNPNSVENTYIDRTKFQYFDRNNLKELGSTWYLGDKQLNVVSSIDFAFSIGTASDYTSIVTIGMDEYSNIYILDIDRFKTNKISVMYDRVLNAHRKWGFRKIRAEVVAAQALIVTQFREFMRQQNVLFSVDEYHPPKTMNKEERIAAALEPRYSNGQIWHYKGGNCQTLEEELMLEKPEHDDVKDCLASAVSIVKPPIIRNVTMKKSNVVYSGRFGGVAFNGV